MTALFTKRLGLICLENLPPVELGGLVDLLLLLKPPLLGAELLPVNEGRLKTRVCEFVCVFLSIKLSIETYYKTDPNDHVSVS